MILLNILKIFHILNEIFLSTYVFFFNKKYDIYYVIYIQIIILHWICLKNECILSYLEKKLINKNYILGSRPYDHPYHQLLPKCIVYCFEILKFFNIIIIFCRNINNHYIFISIIIMFLYLLFNIITRYKKTDKLFF